MVEFTHAQLMFTHSYKNAMVISPSNSSRRRNLMSKFIPGNQKHLTLDARFLCKDPTTISKEVKAHRLSDWYHKGTFYNARNFCIHRYHCRKTNACGKLVLCGVKCTSCPTCNQTCKDFEKEHCNSAEQSTLCLQRMYQKNQSLHHCS